MRNWAVTHRAEFGWMFTTPVPDRAPESPRRAAGESYEQVFAAEVATLCSRSAWRNCPTASGSPTSGNSAAPPPEAG